MQKILNINKEKKEKRNLTQELYQLTKTRSSEKRDNKTITIEFSWKFVGLVALILAVVFWGKQMLTLLIFLFLSIVLMSATMPIITWFTKKKLPKSAAISITYFLGILFILTLLGSVVVPFINQIDNLVESLPNWISTFISEFKNFSVLGFSIDSTAINEFVSDWVSGITFENTFSSVAGLLGGIVGWVTLVLASTVFSIYLLLEHNAILDFGLIRISSDEKRERVKRLVLDLENKLGRWLLGQAVVSTIAGIVLGVILALFGIPFALPMGVFVALLSAIPSLGATFSSVPPILFALITRGPVTAFILLLIFVVYQQIENNFIIPKVMGNMMGIRPIAVLFTAATFLILFGVWGAVLAVPAVVIANICYEFYIDLQKIEAKGSI
jgi:predicted PurR-regulated permease PerM